jgi:hypothetical protein
MTLRNDTEESVLMSACVRPSAATYAGLFLVTLATLMYELLLTPIFSVTMWYHFAFMAISVAMFGMTVGAIIFGATGFHGLKITAKDGAR